MLTIRLQRNGKKGQPSYRLIISEKAKATNSSVLEYLGYYQPANKNKTLELNKERIQYWISKGAQTSETVNNLLVKEGIIEGKKKKTFYIPTKVKKANAEADAKKKADEAAAKEAKEAEAAQTAEATQAAESTEATTEPETQA